MKIFIARDGKQFGPYSMAELQRMVDADQLKISELAWYDGLTDWIQLKEIPGFFYRPAPITIRHQKPPLNQIRPGFVWVICILTFVGTPIPMWDHVYKLVTLHTGPMFYLSDDLREEQTAHCIEAIICEIFNLIGALYLFYLRRPALYYYGGVSLYGLAGLGYLAFTGIPPELLGAAIPMIVFALTYNLAVIGYIFYLYRKDILR